jgi:hypothetical protein
MPIIATRGISVVLADEEGAMGTLSGGVAVRAAANTREGAETGVATGAEET